ncbi:MFS transporter [Puniceicoccaceae bacterium K14]|nr:MFS transporter [Puniceicoccaceae bacterium K14]
MLPRRYIVVVSTFLLSFLLYVDRVCISTAKGQIVTDLGLSDAQFGWVLSAFAFGYALFQAPAGALADRLGARVLLASVVVLWSVFTGLTAASVGFISLLIIRFCFGAGEAGAFPGMARAVYSWIPTGERGLVKGINFSASRLGAAITMPLLPWMINGMGWKASFVLLMFIGFVWATVWYVWFRDEPSEKKNMPQKELEYILSNRQSSTSKETKPQPLPIGKILSNNNMWFMMGQYFASNFTFFFCLSWLFPYVRSTYNLSYTEAGFYTMIPLLGGALGNLVSGALVDAFYRSGKHAISRRLPAIIGFVLASLGLIMSVNQADVIGAVIWLSIAIFGADMTLSPSWSFCIDIGGSHAGKVSGTMNMAGNLGSAIVAIAFPYLFEWTGGSSAFFYVGAGLNLFAIIFWILSNPKGKIETAAA